ncbi:MAG: SprB repeat-containing protein, partial [Bacteroidota bacterium]
MINFYSRNMTFFWLLMGLLIFSPQINGQICSANQTILTVTNTNDVGPGSLREAIGCANAIAGPNAIHFNISGGGPHIIKVGELTDQPLPDLTDAATVIDGTTQSGFFNDPQIVLDGSAANWSGPFDAIQILADYCEVYGLTIRSFPDDAIDVNNAKQVRIGAAGKGNVIYSNGYDQDFWAGFPGNWNGCGVVIQNNADSCFIQGNVIGTNFSQNLNLGNEFCGIIVTNFCLSLTIGGTNEGEENVIANNAEGVLINNAYGISVRENTMYCNDTVAIRLVNNGNLLKSPPEITIAQEDFISGTGNTGDIVEVFIADSDCLDTPCQGKVHLGSTEVINGTWAMSPFGFGSDLQPGVNITATATDLFGSTSPFAPCQIIVEPNTCSSPDGVIWVTTTDDEGVGSLRYAIDCANSSSGADTIKFNLPDTLGQNRIFVGATSGLALPAILDAHTIIDATSQIGFGVDDFSPKVVLDGSENNWDSPINAIWIRADHAAIYGLEIVNFPDDAIDITQANHAIIGAPNKGNVIYNNGSEVDFFTGAPNTGPWEGCGVVLRNGASFCTIQGNYIGTNYEQDSTGGNEFCGVIVQGNCNNNVIGGSLPKAKNIIAYHEIGVRIDAGSNFCKIQQNEMFCNTEGILLLGNANQAIAAPIIDTASGTAILGTGIPGDTIEVFTFLPDGCETTVSCQGKDFLGSTVVTDNSIWILNAPYATGASIFSGVLVTATATDTFNNTSTFSDCNVLNIDCSDVDILFENVEQIVCGNVYGSFEVVPFGGASPYVFDFGEGDTTVSFLDSLVAGWYGVTVTDAEGCVAIDSIEITESGFPELIIENIQNENCGNQNGIISVSTTGGTPPYLYDIGTGPQSSPVFENLSAGVYAVQLLDAAGCEVVEIVTIENIAPPLLAVTSLSNENCNMMDGAFSVTTFGGTPPFLYNIGFGNVTSPNFTNLSNGFYTVVVTDAGGCTSSISVVIFDAPPL